MPIPKIIWQTFYQSVDQLHPIIQEQNHQIRALNPNYEYRFLNDNDIENFIHLEFKDNPKIQECFDQLNIMVAKVDLWRYLALYKYGGVYLDMDSSINRPLDDLIKPSDNAILTVEGNKEKFVQWALIFGPNHPILKHTIDHIIDNITHNRYPNDILRMTGPGAFTHGVNTYHRELYNRDLINTQNNTPLNTPLNTPTLTLTPQTITPSTNIIYGNPTTTYRVYGIDYNGWFEYKYPNHHLLYQNRLYWRTEAETKPLLKGDA